MKHCTVSSLVLVVVLLAGAEAQARSYLLETSGKSSDKLEAAVVVAGGTITLRIPEVGILVVDSARADFAIGAAKIAGVGSVLPNVSWKTDAPVVADAIVSVDDSAALPDSHTTLVTDSFAPLQWGLDAVDAAGAWSHGQQGAGVRVAVLDSGIASGHIDLDANLNTALSTSFVSGETYNFTGTGFNHGTHVAGIIAAAANGVGTVGVAPKAEIVAVKVLSATTGSGSFGGIIAGLVYAANIQADVANMSLGSEFPRSGFIDDNGTPDDPSDDVKVGANEISALVTALGHATTYAYQHGVTVVVSAGNSGIDRDHDANTWVVPADCPHVLSISATGPVGWALDVVNTPLDNLASYSNYGQSRIDFAAPGGDFIYPGSDSSTVAGITRPTWVFDMVFSSANRIGTSNLYAWAAGTSMAAPHATGVAAIIIGKAGHHLNPAQVEAALRASADDLGKPGNDDAYGAGRVNAGRAAQ